jgi:hypothetical protein
MTQRTNFTISEANLRWLQSQAQGERGLSHLVDSLIQKERTLGPIESRIQRQVERIDRLVGVGHARV